MKENSYLNQKDVFLPERKRNSNKFDYGRILVIGGCTGFSGAPRMASLAALRVGAGLVSVAVPEDIYTVVASSQMEAMVFSYPSDENGRFHHKAIPSILDKASRSDVLIIGPGLGRGDSCTALVKELLQGFKKPIVLDADGLYALSCIGIDNIKQSLGSVVITPHYGEFKRLTDMDPTSDPVSSASRYSMENGIITVLKGPESVIAFPDGGVRISQRGNPGMATGGSGDVLAGMIGGFLGQMSIRDAVINGVYLHGLAGDRAAEEMTEYSMLPSDLIRQIPAVIKEIINNERSIGTNE